MWPLIFAKMRFPHLEKKKRENEESHQAQADLVNKEINSNRGENWQFLWVVSIWFCYWTIHFANHQTLRTDILITENQGNTKHEQAYTVRTTWAETFRLRYFTHDWHTPLHETSFIACILWLPHMAKKQNRYFN